MHNDLPCLQGLLWIAPPVPGKYAQLGTPLLPEVSAALRPTSSSVHGQSENLNSVLTHVRGVGVRGFSFRVLAFDRTAARRM